MKANKWFANLALIAALAAPALAAAQGPRAVRMQAEMSMVLTGKVRIAAGGAVEDVSVDREGEVPQQVAKLIRQAAPQWRFEPLAADAPAVSADMPMTVRVAVRRDPQQGEDVFVMRIVSATFDAQGPGEAPRSGSMTPPTYPMQAALVGMPATVYVVARFGRDGKVADAFVEQVNLHKVGSEQQMVGFRKSFAAASLAAAKRWSFVPPSQGKAAAEHNWQVRVPVAFMLAGTQEPAYGQWDVYVPGPRQRAPWAQRSDDIGVDALAGNGPRLVGHGRRLIGGFDGNG
ncbi:protein tonB [Lysobacter enzymogenes]|uniref:protein tonB n=1 Tax=Lysobacter enzymogenes TaxID=69 RepID=UPI001A9759C9|nr:protein tonB [Lysobacter enzymogenes]QQP95206.1 protein tonB [Lysobacter enzymogenes]